MRVISKAFPSFPRHERSNFERRELHEEIRRLRPCPFEKIAEEGLEICLVLAQSYRTPIRVDEKSQATICVLKHNEDDGRSAARSFRAVAQGAEPQNGTVAGPRRFPILSLLFAQCQ